MMLRLLCLVVCITTARGTTLTVARSASLQSDPEPDPLEFAIGSEGDTTSWDGPMEKGDGSEVFSISDSGSAVKTSSGFVVQAKESKRTGHSTEAVKVSKHRRGVARDEQSYKSSKKAKGAGEDISLLDMFAACANYISFILVAACAVAIAWYGWQKSIVKKAAMDTDIQLSPVAKDRESSVSSSLQWVLSSECAQSMSTKFGFLLSFDESGARSDLLYSNFLEKVSRTQRALMSHGLLGKRVLVMAPPEVDYYVTLSACLKSGVIIVPVLPTALSDFEWVRRVVGQSGAEFVLTTRDLQDEWKEKEGNDPVRHNRTNWPLNFIELHEFLNFPFELLKQKGPGPEELRQPNPNDPICICPGMDDTSFPALTTWTNKSLLRCAEQWNEAGVGAKAAVASLGPHTDGVAVGLFLATLKAGGQFVCAAGGVRPSLGMLRQFGISHCYVPDMLQDAFNWGESESALSALTGQKVTAFVRSPAAGFVKNAKEHHASVHSMYFSGVHLGGCKGKTSHISVLSEPLWQEGVVTVAPKGAFESSETLYSCGKFDKEEQVIVKTSSGPSQKDVVGEIWVQQSLCTGMVTFAGKKVQQRGDVQGYVCTGELGFVSSQDNHLYIVARLADGISTSGGMVSASKIEAKIRDRHPTLKEVAVFASQAKSNPGALLACEIQNQLDCEIMMQRLTDQMQEEGVPLEGVAFVPDGQLPRSPLGDGIWRARAQMQWYAKTLPTFQDCQWEGLSTQDSKLQKIDQVRLNKKMEELIDSDSDDEVAHDMSDVLAHSEDMGLL